MNIDNLSVSSGDTLVSIVVPCYNESEVLGITILRLEQLLDELFSAHRCSPKSFIVFVDDGSDDDTWNIISAASEYNPGRIRGIRLVNNVGHQYALLAGLHYVTKKCDVSISIDADLQDDLTAISAMIAEFRKGAEIVFGVRKSRVVDSWFKRNTALFFYKLMRWMGCNIVENHADFRLLSARTLCHLSQFSESNIFLRGLTPLLHRRVATVTYERAKRIAGVTKYPIGKMLSLAWNGITSFSVAPLHLISIIGASVFLISLVMIAYAIIVWIHNGALPGWTSVVVPLYFLGGLTIISIGILGEYLAKVFLEVKHRPRFLVDTVVGELDK